MSVRRPHATRPSPSSASAKRDDEAAVDKRGAGVFDPLFTIFANNDAEGKDIRATSATSASEASQSRQKQPWWRATAAALAIAAVMLASPLDAQAARSGGRMVGERAVQAESS